MPGRRYALPRHPGAISIVHLTQKVPIGEVRVRYPRALHRGGARESMIGAELSTVRCVLLVPCRTEIARLVGTGRAAGFRMGLWVMCHHFPTLSRSIRATARFLSARDPQFWQNQRGARFEFFGFSNRGTLLLDPSTVHHHSFGRTQDKSVSKWFTRFSPRSSRPAVPSASDSSSGSPAPPCAPSSCP